MSRLQHSRGGSTPAKPTRGTRAPHANLLTRNPPPMTPTLPDHPPESLPPGEAWRLLGPGSPARVAAPHQGLSGPCSASGHPQPGGTAAPQSHPPHPTLAFSPSPISPHPVPTLTCPLLPNHRLGPPALGALTGFPVCTTGISVEWPRSRGGLTSRGPSWVL